jgi:nitrilase
MNKNTLTIAMAQIAPVWLNKDKTIEKIKSYISQAANKGCELVVFGESLLPGYPFWLSITDASTFESKVQKELHAHYIRNAIKIEAGELDDICHLAKQYKIAIYLGIIERAQNRGGHSLYCSLVYIVHWFILMRMASYNQCTVNFNLLMKKGCLGQLGMDMVCKCTH